jgi:Family of unknown function (DUF6941)
VKLIVSALCDRATVREGLLHVLGAGVTNITTRLPALLPLDLALMARLEPEDAGAHQISIVLEHEDTEDKLGELKGDFEVSAEALNEPELPLANVPFPVPLSDFRLSKAGSYIVKIALDGTKVDTLRLLVREQQAIPPEST